ncbi:MAG: arginine--tRNA ligase [Candidatus Diapherotrites archaeon]|nr:arginine--tRNA ligase [Candidatus Diapherotrites archaeon]
MDFAEKIAGLLAKEIGLEKTEIGGLLVKPPQGMGDYSFPCFRVSKQLKEAPEAVSKRLAGKISADFLEKVESKGAYLNFFVEKEAIASSTIKKILSKKWSFSNAGKGKVMVEYSSPNTNKPLHVGHLRNNSLGAAVSNILEEAGYKVIKANLINDRGIHICKAMIAYEMFAKGKTPKSEGLKSDHFVGGMYVLFNEKAKEDSSLEEKAQGMLRAWEKGDRKTIALWKKMNDWALSGIKETYKEFGTEFDIWFKESETFRKGSGAKIIEEGLKKRIFSKEDDGSVLATLEPELQNKVLVRKDGTSLYITNDLGLTEEKFEKFKLDKCVWVVANEQDLYFKQLFKIFEKLDRKWAKNCFHLNYGYVSLPSGRMKSREGNVVDADDLILEIKKLAEKEIEARYKKISEKEKKERAKAIALAAIKFYLLRNDAKKDMVFEPEKSISFDGETGPYVQYSYARARSILRKAGKKKAKVSKKDFVLLTHEKEKELLVALANFDEAVSKSISELSPHHVAHALLAVSERFNSFYQHLSVLEGGKEKNARLALVEATSIVLKKGLEILEIEALEEM